jgi:hypothetical protein
MKFVTEHCEVMEEYIHKQREVGRLLGTLERSRFPEVHVNP